MTTFQHFPIIGYAGYQPYLVWFKPGPRNSIYYEGDSVLLQYDHIEDHGTSRAATYRVLDYWGTEVASGSLAAGWTSLNLGNSWAPGWYRVLLSGSTYDSDIGHSCGDTNFGVIRSHPNFPPLPAASYNPVAGFSFENPVNMPTRAALGIGMGRLSIIGGLRGHESATNDRVADNETFMTAAANPLWLAPANSAYLDPVRPRYQFASFPNFDTAYDSIQLLGVSMFTTWVSLTAKTKARALEGDKIYASNIPGSVSGRKVTIYYPNASTPVEVYDNLDVDDFAATCAAINASSYVKACPGNSTSPKTIGPTQLGKRAYEDVVAAVSTLYAVGVTHFEGPVNEPTLDASWAEYMRVFAYAVHDGNANAKAIGPCTVDITDTGRWGAFLDAGGGAYCDEISFHDYNTCINGDINQARQNIEQFLGWLDDHGLSGKPLWQTEANSSLLSVAFGVFHPRRARNSIIKVLLWEQYDVPFERNPYWYDWSHGFWGHPAWFLNDFPDTSVLPTALLLCTYAQEVFGKNYDHAVDFDSVANKIFLGNVYGDSDSVMVLVAATYMPDSTVTLSITGTASDITVVDGWGNESSVAQSSGRITVSVTETPTYIRLPAGVTASVYSVRDWGPSPGEPLPAIAAELGGVAAPELSDGLFMQRYIGYRDSLGVAYSSIEPPDSAVLLFDEDVHVGRVIIWCGPAHQEHPTLLDYDIDTWDGATWTTRKTVTKTTPTSFLHGSLNTGCQRETYWDEQWIEDVKLDRPVSCSGVRVYIREMSYGGEPDLAAISDGVVDYISVNGMKTPMAAFQEIAVLGSVEPILAAEMIGAVPI